MRRIVGYFEYGNALANLEELVRRCSPSELQAVDELVGESETYTVYSGLARSVNYRDRHASASDSDGHARRGLAWLMALARVELGSMLATFTRVPNPYATVLRTQFGLPEYAELLRDGGLTHVGALNRDPYLKTIANQVNVTPEVLSYSRRMTLGKQMLEAATAAAMKTGSSSAEVAELNHYRQKMEAAQAIMIAKIQMFLEMMNSQQTNVKTYDKDFVRACDKVLAMEKSYLAKGKGKVTTFPQSSGD